MYDWQVATGDARRHKVVSFANDIRPLFTDEDVEHMLDVNPDIDLSSYDAVRAFAQDIYSVLSEGAMPPGAPWPDEDVARFKQWMDENFPQ